MRRTIKIKQSKDLKNLLESPNELAFFLKISFALNKEGYARIDLIENIEKELLKNLIDWGVLKLEGALLSLVDDSVIDLGLKKPKKVSINNKELAGCGVVPKELKEYYEIAMYFRDLFYKNMKLIGGRTNNLDNAKFGAWVTPIRLMFETDKVTKEQLREVYKFLDKEDFWRDKIQSTKKLREKFNTLYNQLKSNERREKNINDRGENNGIQSKDKNGATGYKNKGGYNKSGSGSKLSPEYLKRVFGDLRT